MKPSYILLQALLYGAVQSSPVPSHPNGLEEPVVPAKRGGVGNTWLETNFGPGKRDVSGQEKRQGGGVSNPWFETGGKRDASAEEKRGGVGNTWFEIGGKRDASAEEKRGGVGNTWFEGNFGGKRDSARA